MVQDIKKPTKQLQEWGSQFGNDYVERNEFEEWKLAPGVEAFRRMIGDLKLDSILEVGSNIGLNLVFIDTLFNGKVKLHAVEPNKKAYGRLMANKINLAQAWNCDGFHLPLPDASVDLVLTNGVLIHIAPDDLVRITDEIVRVSKKYILCSEYFSTTPEEKSYHGQDGLLFKRDFGSFYLDRHPTLKIVDYGFLWQREFKIFDDLNWWLFEK
ncbi:MAG: methyltransferase domain-containing protein [Deltaproteobacteria bacterium]|nr:methyltransferase domain-containing protein [Deltaproteobacteria bacterium]